MPEQGYLHGFHDPGGERLMEDAPGWVLFTEKLGADPNNRKGPDYSYLADRGFRVMARLNHGYGKEGTVPDPSLFDAFALRCGAFVNDSQGCQVWIVGNEPNHPNEWPNGIRILPSTYALVYAKVEREIHKQPRHEQDIVLPAPVAPYCAEVRYPGNERGDWIRYYADVLEMAQACGARIDGIGIHAYLHGHDPRLVTDDTPMGDPFGDRFYNFRCYRQLLEAVPKSLRHLPAYITEFNPTDGWLDVNNGLIVRALEEIAGWNGDTTHQQIRSLILYRWWKCDRWHIEDRGALHGDFRAAVQRRFVWVERTPDTPPPTQPPTTEERIREIVREEIAKFRKELGQIIAGQGVT